MKTNIFFQKLVAVVSLGISILISYLMISEWIRVGVWKNVSGYCFGSEGMIEKGGWIYKYSSLYANSCLIEGIFFIVISGFLFTQIGKNGKWKLTAIYSGIMLLLFITFWIIQFLPTLL
jgi:hypothetical protein